MDNNIFVKEPNPQGRANFLSKLTFVWFISLLKKCVKQKLTVQDLYKHLPCDESSELCHDLEINWNDEIKKNKPSFFRAIRKTYFRYYFVYGIVQFIQFTFIYSAQPVMLAKFINLFSDDINENQNNVISMSIYGALMALMSFIISFFNNHLTLILSQIGMRMRIASCSLVYKKALKLSPNAMNQSSTGHIVNLLSNDVSRFDLVSFYLNHIWIMPLQVLIVTYFVYHQVGISAVIGVGSFILLTIPVNAAFGKMTSSLRLTIAKRTDDRVKKMAEIISGIQIIKMYVWEKPFAKVVEIARNAEIDILLWVSYIRGIILSSSVFMQRTILFITTISYVLLGNTITPDKVFSILQFFTILQLSLAIFFPLALTFGAETLVTIRRLEEFLLLEEKSEPLLFKNISQSINLLNIDASWNSEMTLLNNITTHIRPGSLCAIIGPVGAGKSSLIQLLLGELKQSRGSIAIGGSTSYSSQEPWLFTSTVRKNILFGQKFNRELYEEVVRVCALEKDFELLPKGDETMVGERGVSLSGGQKSRINLARCVYRSADIYFLDDPLSAVDTHVGQHLFERCIGGYLKNKTRVLVTHQMQYLVHADHIILLEDGEIKTQGTFNEVSKFDLAFAKSLRVSRKDEEIGNDREELTPSEIFYENGDAEKEKPSDAQMESKKQSGSSVLTSIVRKISNASSISKKISLKKAKQLENTEETFTENKSLGSVYWEYAKAGGKCHVLLTLLFLLIFSQVVSMGADLWLTNWTRLEVDRITSCEHKNFKYDTNFLEIFGNIQNSSSECDSLMTSETSMHIYTALVLVSILLVLYRAMYFYKTVMNASKNLHNKMFISLLHSPMRFFNINPSGRILNRFSRDMGMIDEILPRMMLEALQIALIMFSIFILVSIANPYLIIITILLCFVYNRLIRWYMVAARNLKHLEGITRSPVFSHLSASTNGITTIRSVKAEKILTEEFDAHQDIHTSAWYLTLVCTGAFGLWIDFISASYVTCVIFSFILLSQFQEINGSNVGLAVAQSFMLTGAVQYGMFQTAQVVSQMTSVERILEYTKLDQEEPEIIPIPDEKPLSSWPPYGSVKFVKVSLRYSELVEPVLKNLIFEIKAGEKIGIVGRTGAGKSSLISALFRLAPLEGQIFIDEIDTKTIALKELRKKISIIPQEPVLFSSTLRYNLDPFDEFTDEQLWNVLGEVELKEGINSLNFLVQEGGANFSVGQRQLLCLARAILRNNKILVLDEATANIDPITDQLIQKTIRIKFKTCTVLTIAHRLNTIMDSDKVLVMDEGCLVDFDHPYNLLQNVDGHFSKLVAQTGQSTSEHLQRIAEDAFTKSEK